MKDRRIIRLLVLLVCAAPCWAQSPSRVALIDTRAFNDPTRGIARLVNATRLVDQEFEPRRTELSKMYELVQKQREEVAFAGPIPTDARPMTPGRRRKLQNQAEEMQRCFELKEQEVLSAYGSRLEELLASVSENVRRSLESFSKSRGITMLIDAAGLSCPLGCQIESAADIDITREFIAEYNRLHP